MNDHARIRYVDGAQFLDVRLIHSWNRGEVVPVSGSSGLKDYVKNQVWQVFEDDPEIDRVVMVRAGGPPLFLLQVKGYWFDVTGKQVIAVRPSLARQVAAPASALGDGLDGDVPDRRTETGEETGNSEFAGGLK